MKRIFKKEFNKNILRIFSTILKIINCIDFKMLLTSYQHFINTFFLLSKSYQQSYQHYQHIILIFLKNRKI